jgi:UDP-glucose 4-epimerase
MRVLVSGSSGLIGGAVVEHLSAQGDQVVRFDIADGHDVLDADDYAAAARGCDAIVHAAGGGSGQMLPIRTNASSRTT